VQDKSFELSKDDSGFLNFASSGLDSNSDNAGDDGPPGDSAPSPMPPSSTSMDDQGLGSKPPSRPTTAEDGARSLSPMSSEDGPDTRSTDVGFEKTKSEDMFKKPVEDLPLEEVGNPAMMPPGMVPATRADPMSWVTLLYEYSQGTTMHGLPYITHSARFVLRRSAISRDRYSSSPSYLSTLVKLNADQLCNFTFCRRCITYTLLQNCGAGAMYRAWTTFIRFYLSLFAATSDDRHAVSEPE